MLTSRRHPPGSRQSPQNKLAKRGAADNFNRFPARRGRGEKRLSGQAGGLEASRNRRTPSGAASAPEESSREGRCGPWGPRSMTPESSSGAPLPQSPAEVGSSPAMVGAAGAARVARTNAPVLHPRHGGFQKVTNSRKCRKRGKSKERIWHFMKCMAISYPDPYPDIRRYVDYPRTPQIARDIAKKMPQKNVFCVFHVQGMCC